MKALFFIDRSLYYIVCLMHKTRTYLYRWRLNKITESVGLNDINNPTNCVFGLFSTCQSSKDINPLINYGIFKLLTIPTLLYLGYCQGLVRYRDNSVRGREGSQCNHPPLFSPCLSHLLLLPLPLPTKQPIIYRQCYLPEPTHQ